MCLIILQMVDQIPLDKILHFTDPTLNAIDAFLQAQPSKKIKLPSKCQLITTASRYVRESRLKGEVETTDRGESVDDVKSISSNNSKLRPKKRKKYQDMSQVASVDYQNFDMGFVLYQNYSEQSSIILKYLLGKDPTSVHMSPYQKDILKGWIMCLDREDRMEVERQRTWFPNPRNIELRHIDAGLNQIYGTGVKRRLRPGEQASLIQAIDKYLGQCSKNPSQISVREKAIFEVILGWAELQGLEKYPFCMKQLQCHFKLMATRWRYSGKLNLSNKNIQKAVYTAQSRGHFLDLSKQDNQLVKYLIKYSNYSDVMIHTNRQKTPRLNSSHTGRNHTNTSQLHKP